MALIDGMLQELEQEAQTTRRLLERAPMVRWLAAAPKARRWAISSCGDGPRRRRPARGFASPAQAAVHGPQSQSASELIPALDQSMRRQTKCSAAWTTRLMATWRLMQHERELLALRGSPPGRSCSITVHHAASCRCNCANLACRSVDLRTERGREPVCELSAVLTTGESELTIAGERPNRRRRSRR
jgi:hypothetical protein